MTHTPHALFPLLDLTLQLKAQCITNKDIIIIIIIYHSHGHGHYLIFYLDLVD